MSNEAWFDFNLHILSLNPGLYIVFSRQENVISTFYGFLDFHQFIKTYYFYWSITLI